MLTRTNLAGVCIETVTDMFGYVGHNGHDIMFTWILTFENLGITEFD